jgi:hypothetical protein
MKKRKRQVIKFHRLFFNLAMVVMVLAVFLPSGAMADFMVSEGTLYISSPNDTLSPYNPPYLKIEVTASGAVANFTVTSLASGNFLYLFGGNDALGLNFNIPTGDHIALTNFVGTPWKNSPDIEQAGSQNMSAFGRMNTTVSLSDGYKDALKGLTFTATLLNAANQPVNFPGGILLVENVKGFDAAAHIFVQDITNTNDTVTTGFAGGTAPVPTSVLLLGSGLMGLGLLGYRRKRS